MNWNKLILHSVVFFSEIQWSLKMSIFVLTVLTAVAHLAEGLTLAQYTSITDCFIKLLHVNWLC